MNLPGKEVEQAVGYTSRNPRMVWVGWSCWHFLYGCLRPWGGMTSPRKRVDGRQGKEQDAPSTPTVMGQGEEEEPVKEAEKE